MTHIFIVNPYSGYSKFSENLREKLSRINNLNYFVFNTRYAGYEEYTVRKVRHFFEGEKLRFYCCGGSGTMRSMLLGFDDISEAEVAFYPCGMTNDFLKAFDISEDSFRDLEALVNGDVINVDCIASNHGYALNTISLGLDTKMAQKTNDYRLLRSFADWLPYTLSLLNVMYFAKQHDYIVELDGQEIDQTCIEIIFGNGNILGGNLFFSESKDIFDGKGSYFVAPEMHGIKEISMLLALMNKETEKIKTQNNCGLSERITVRRKDGSLFSAGFDGELVSGIKQLDARILHKALRFVVPRSTTGGGYHE